VSAPVRGSVGPTAEPFVRVAGVVQLPRIVRLVESAYRGDDSRAGWTTEADLLEGQRTDPDEVRHLLVSVRDAILFTGDRADPLACCTVGRHDGRVALGMFAVRPSRQGGGVGAGMLAAAERYVRERWAPEHLDLWVLRQRAELIAWYERRGYARTGETKPFPYGDRRFGVPLRDDLEFVVMRKALAPASGPASPGPDAPAAP
jgi:GNAT superfamily N-acetyltransferase